MSFILPPWGGAMVHSDPQMSDCIAMKIPEKDVKIVWERNTLVGEKAGSKGNGMVGNGTIAACTFSGVYDNLVVYNYAGKRLWSSKGMLNAVATASSPMVSIDNKIIACDNKTIFMLNVSDDACFVEWIQHIPQVSNGLLIPFSPTIVREKIILLPTRGGPVYAFDTDTGELLSMKWLGKQKSDDPYYSTVNSACVSNKRLYIAGESNKKTEIPKSRLFAIDVRIDGSFDDLFEDAWFCPYNGVSQASPLFVGDTVYVDGYTKGWQFLKNAKVYALTEKQDGYTLHATGYPNRTMFSFTKDPRGGFWYEDTKDCMLVHFQIIDDEICIVEKIAVNDFIPNLFGTFRPLSCMTICGTTDPIMLISAITLFFNKYVVAIRLGELGCEDSYEVCWRVKTNVAGMNYSGGQYTILKKDDDPYHHRILYGGYWGGVIALGTEK